MAEESDESVGGGVEWGHQQTFGERGESGGWCSSVSRFIRHCTRGGGAHGGDEESVSLYSADNVEPLLMSTRSWGHNAAGGSGTRFVSVFVCTASVLRPNSQMYRAQ
jgi:hypothetical protein